MIRKIALGALLVSAAIVNCTSTDSKPKAGDAGTGGEAPGGEAPGAGGEAPGNAGVPSSPSGGSTHTGGAGQGGEAGEASGAFSVEGTVYAPPGGDVEGTVVIGCAWLNEECNEDKSQVVQVADRGRSASYTLPNLESGVTYLVLFWKDVNQTGEVDDDDYVGVVADESGAARAFTSAAASADGIMSIQRAVVPTDVPEELVGDWFTVATSIGVTNGWTFGADGSATNAFTMNSAVCGGGAGTAINSQGVISVDGDELTFSPTSGKKTVKPCSGDSTTTDYYTNVRHFTWRVGASTKEQGGTALFLVDQQDTTQTEAEFQRL